MQLARLIFLLMISNLLVLQVSAQTRDKGPWWPHPIWGQDDQSGGSNWITPSKIIKALSLV